jgi:heptosyltransferase II
MKKFLVINPFGIGDCLFTTPAIKALKVKYPDSFIGYWSNLRVAPLLRKDPRIDKVFALSRGDLKKLYQESFLKGISALLKLVAQIKKERFDISFDFSLDHRYSLLAKIIGIRQRVGFDYKGRGRFLTQSAKIENYQDRHVVEYYSGLLKFLDIPVEDKSLALTVLPPDELKAKKVLAAAGIKEGDRLVGIFPGAGGSWGKDALIKHWSPVKFAQTADQLIGKIGVKVILLGDEGERGISETIRQMMVHQPVDLTGKTSLEVLPAIMKNCGLIITNDGGPMHMAVALGIKSVSVFGPVSEIVYGPYPPEAGHLVLKSDLGCRPCYKNFRLSVCDKDKECLKQVSVEAVLDAAMRLLV